MHGHKGFTLTEVIVASAIFLFVAVGAYNGFTSVFASISSARLKALASDLANARLEVIRNMPYSQVGVQGGNPSGSILANEEVVVSGVSFSVSAQVIYVDDPFDSLSGAGDLFPQDYKKVEVTISCDSCRNFSPVAITAIFAPKSLESI